MKTTTQILDWLKTADLKIEGLAVASSSLKDLNLYHMKNFKTPVSRQLFRQYLDNPMIQGSSLDTSLDKLTQNKGSPLALVVQPLGLRLAFYSFVNDDKYFLTNIDDVGYQDTNLYDYFYQTLPNLSNAPIDVICESKYDLWIFPRSQYGHFIFDELIPSLVGYYKYFKSPPRKIRLLSTKQWQKDATRSIFKMLFNANVAIDTTMIGKMSQIFELFGGTVIIPSFWRCHVEARNLLYAKSKKINLRSEEKPKIFLSRENFDEKESIRIRNISKIQHVLSKYKFKTIMPHEHTLEELHDICHNASSIVSEPGTTPLLGYLAGGKETDFIGLYSLRCLKDCPPPYVYSGWRYHIPWIDKVKNFVWGDPIRSYANPFSDQCNYNVESLKRVLDHV